MDRRELNIQWSKSEQQPHIATNQHVAIFLPVSLSDLKCKFISFIQIDWVCQLDNKFQPNPRLSATRNQLRQKLAKYSSSDFAHLMIDLLKEIRRRHLGHPMEAEKQRSSKNKECGKPLVFSPIFN
jgi:hypothetical protein